MTGYEKMARLIEAMGKETLLDELLRALSEDELKRTAKWIARMYEVEISE